MQASQKLIVPILLAACLIVVGCSDSENSVTTPTIDTAPPAIPTGLKSCTGECVIKLYWDPNITDTDFEGYRVYRMAFDQIWNLTYTPLTEALFVDRTPLANQCTYGVTAVDADGNESGWSVITVNCRIDDQHMRE